MPAQVRFWVCYDVATNGSAYVRKNYDDGHSFKCKWTAFINDLTSHADRGVWRIAEDTDVRKVVAYTDAVVSMTVFQLVVVELPILSTDKPNIRTRGNRHRRPARGQVEYITIGQCIANGSHLTDCDGDGFCNLCGEQ